MALFIRSTTAVAQSPLGGVSRTMNVLALSAVALFGSIQASYAATADEIKERGYIVVATEDDYRPFEFIENGKPMGYDNDLKRLVEKKTGLELKQEVLPWAGILPGVTSGKFDMALSAVMVTDERRKIFDYTTPTAESATYYGVKAGSDIKSKEDLVGKVVGAQTGSAFLGELKKFDAAMKAETGEGVKKIVEYQSYPEAYQDLAFGRIDAVVNTDVTLNTLVQEREGMFELGEPISTPAHKAWAVKKGNADVLKVVNDALLEVRESGEMYELQKKWFGVSYEKMPLDVN